MSRNTRILSGLGVALLTVAMATPALAGRGHRGGGMLNPDKIERMAEKLGLSDAQVETIQGIAERARAQKDALREQKRAARDRLHEELKSDQPSREAALAAVEEIGRVKTEMKKLRVATLLDIRAQLTPEQVATFRELRESRRGRKHHKRGKRGRWHDRD